MEASLRFSHTCPNASNAEVLTTSVPQNSSSPVPRRTVEPVGFQSCSPLRQWLEGLHVVIAEDNSINQRVMQALLKTANPASLVSCHDGQETLEHVSQNPPDLILMDVHMPRMDGIEATRRLRAQGFQGPIISVTANMSPVIRTSCLEAGVTDHLTKPIDPETLSECFRKIFQPSDKISGQNGQKPRPEPCCDNAIFDVPAFFESFCGDTELCDEVTAAFLEQTHDQIQRIEIALRNRNYQGLIDAYHKLQGSAQTLKAARLEKVCARGETLAREHAPDEEQVDHLEALLQSFSQLRKCLAKAFPGVE